MKKKPEYIEGLEALDNFDKALGQVLKVPHKDIKTKLEAEKSSKAEGTKRKRKDSQ